LYSIIDMFHSHIQCGSTEVSFYHQFTAGRQLCNHVCWQFTSRHLTANISRQTTQHTWLVPVKMALVFTQG